MCSRSRPVLAGMVVLRAPVAQGEKFTVTITATGYGD